MPDPRPVRFGPPPVPNRKKWPYQATATFQGLRVLVENLPGSVREGEDGDGNKWRTKMKAAYGEFAGTLGTDGDPVDVFIGPDADAPHAYVIHQKFPGTQVPDEDKVVLGCHTLEEARDLYMAHYDRPGFYHGATRWTMDELKAELGKKRARGKRLDMPIRIRKLVKAEQLSLVGDRKIANRPGFILAPSGKDPRVKRWQRVKEQRFKREFSSDPETVTPDLLAGIGGDPRRRFASALIELFGTATRTDEAFYDKWHEPLKFAVETSQEADKARKSIEQTFPSITNEDVRVVATAAYAVMFDELGKDGLGYEISKNLPFLHHLTDPTFDTFEHVLDATEKQVAPMLKWLNDVNIDALAVKLDRIMEEFYTGTQMKAAWDFWKDRNNANLEEQDRFIYDVKARMGIDIKHAIADLALDRTEAAARRSTQDLYGEGYTARVDILVGAIEDTQRAHRGLAAGHWGSADRYNKFARGVAVVSGASYRPLPNLEPSTGWHVKRSDLVKAAQRRAYAQRKIALASREKWPKFYRGMALSQEHLDWMASGEVTEIPLTGCTALAFDRETAEHYATSKWTAGKSPKGQDVPVLIEIARDDVADFSVSGWHPNKGRVKGPAFEIMSGAERLVIEKVEPTPTVYTVYYQNRVGTIMQVRFRPGEPGHADWVKADRQDDTEAREAVLQKWVGKFTSYVDQGVDMKPTIIHARLAMYERHETQQEASSGKRKAKRKGARGRTRDERHARDVADPQAGQLGLFKALSRRLGLEVRPVPASARVIRARLPGASSSKSPRTRGLVPYDALQEGDTD